MQEYNEYRKYYSYLFILVNVVLAFFIDIHFLDVFWYGVNLDFYVSISLRERVLKV